MKSSVLYSKYLFHTMHRIIFMYITFLSTHSHVHTTIHDTLMEIGLLDTPGFSVKGYTKIINLETSRIEQNKNIKKVIKKISIKNDILMYIRFLSMYLMYIHAYMTYIILNGNRIIWCTWLLGERVQIR